MNEGEMSPVSEGKFAARILPVAVIVLFAVLYSPVFAKLIKQWAYDANYQHGIAVPLFSSFLIWKRRSKLKSIPVNPSRVKGIAVIAVASGLLIGGTAASELFVERLSLPLMLIGILLYLRGSAFVRALAFPLGFLFMMIPLPYIIYYRLTFPMQLMSAKMAAGLLEAMGMDLLRYGNIIALPNYTLEVVAACSGLRSLMTLVTLALVICAVSKLDMKRKVALVALSAPIAIAANIIRLAVTAIGAKAAGPAFADGILHEISGLIVFGTGFACLVLVWGILAWLQKRENRIQQ